MKSEYSKNEIDLAYILGIAIGASFPEKSSIDAIAKELERLEGLGTTPSEIIDSLKNLPL